MHAELREKVARQVEHHCGPLPYNAARNQCADAIIATIRDALLSEGAVEAAAKSISGAPFPSRSSITRTRAALSAVLAKIGATNV